MAAALLLLVVPLGVGAAASAQQAPLPPEVVTDPLAGTVEGSPAVVGARAARDAAGWRLDAARREVDRLGWEAVGLAAEQAGLDAGQQELAARLATAEVRAREAFVAAYIGGRPADLTEILLSTSSAGDLAFRIELLTRHVEQRTDTVREYTELEAHLDGVVADLAGRLAANEIARQQAAAELVAADAEVRSTTEALELAEAQEALRVQVEARAQLLGAGRPYKAAGSDGSPTPDQSGNAKGLAWDLLRQCESGGNYAAVNPSGAFRGAYQFHMTTWHMLGGVGDPIDALTADQDYRAQLLYDMLGAKPWPQCGRYLKMTPEQLQAVVSGVPLATSTTTTVPADGSTTTVTSADPSSTTSTSPSSPSSSAAPPAD